MDGVTMAGVTIAGVAMADNNPPQLFRRMMVTKLRQSLAAVQATPQFLPTQVRDQALHILSYGLKEEAIPTNERWTVTRNLLLELAPHMELMGHRLDWIPYLEQGFREGEKRDETQTVGECQLQLGLIYRLLGEFDQSQRWVKSSIDSFVSSCDKYGQARGYLELAWIAHLQHRYVDATAHAEEAHTLLAPDAPEQALYWRTLGAIAMNQGHYAAAQDYHQMSLQRFEQLGDARKTAWALQNLARAFYGQRQYQTAINYYQRSAATLLDLGDLYHWAHVQMNLGTAYCDAGQPMAGTSCYQNANRIFSNMDDKLNIAKSNTGLGLGYWLQETFDLAEVAFCRSIEQFADLKDEGARLNAVDGLAMTYLSCRKYQKAIAILEQALADLPGIVHAPNYQYLQKSLNQHLEQAQEGIQLLIE